MFQSFVRDAMRRAELFAVLNLVRRFERMF